MTNANVTDLENTSKQQKGRLIPILENIQAKFGYLPEEELCKVSTEYGISLVDIYGVATFYSAFSLKPRGKHLISACLGTACHVRGGQAIAKEIEQQLNVKAGETTEDKEFTFETVNCLGACALGPVVVVDGRYFASVKVSKVKEIIETVSKGLDVVDAVSDERVFPLEVSCARCNHSLMDNRHIIDGHAVIKVTISFGNKHGWLVLSSVYGRDKVESQYKIPDEQIVQMFCPHCHSELIGGTTCSECEAPMVPMIVKGGGVVQICSRSGCKGHLLDLGGASIG